MLIHWVFPQSSPTQKGEPGPITFEKGILSYPEVIIKIKRKVYYGKIM